MNGFKESPSHLSPAGTKYRHCSNCGLGFDDDPKAFAEHWVKDTTKHTLGAHIDDVMAVYVADGGDDMVKAFEELAESWKDNRKLYDHARYVVYLARISLTGKFPK